MRVADVIYIDWEQHRVWVNHRRWRVHHGPFGLAGGLLCVRHGPFGLIAGGLLCAWGLTDLHDRRDWFRYRDPQL